MGRWSVESKPEADPLCVCVCDLQYWTDHYLRWNATDYPGVTNVRFPDSQIWRPDILLYNRYQHVLLRLTVQENCSSFTVKLLFIYST